MMAIVVMPMERKCLTDGFAVGSKGAGAGAGAVLTVFSEVKPAIACIASTFVLGTPALTSWSLNTVFMALEFVFVAVTFFSTSAA